MRAVTDFFRANPQAFILLLICVILGLGTFLAVAFGIASSGSTRASGYPSDAILAMHALFG